MYLGIEIGGTKLQVGVGRGDGKLLALWRDTVLAWKGATGIQEQILAAVPELLEKAGLARDQLRGVGVGFGGPVDDATRTVIKSHQIEGWDAFPLADWIQNLLGWEVALGNDAEVAGLGEALFGAGKGLSPIFYITIGSGIGGGLIVNGEIYRGCGRGAAEIGHLVLYDREYDADQRQHGQASLVESLASGWAIAGHARDAPAFKRGEGSLLYRGGKDPRSLTTLDVVEAAAANDAFALGILNEAWVHLANGISHVITLLCPRRIVIGGGVSLMGNKLFFQPLRELVKARVFPPFAICYDIVPAALGEEVVVHGALALARKRFYQPGAQATGG